MKQILAIFIKDSRRFWPEILVELAITAALVFVYPKHWLATESPQGQIGSVVFSEGTLSFLANCLIILVPVSWWILIARVIHGERLVGTTQFWLTRPYEWPKLLASKILFLIVFLYAPFSLAQCLLLVEAGFRPFSYLPGLLLNLFLITSLIVLPLLAFSAITRSFAKITLAILGIILYIAAIMIVGSFIPADSTGRGPSPIAGDLALLLLIGGCAAVIVVQYSSRRSGISWILITTVAIAFCALTFLDPDQFLIDHYYPASRSGTTIPVTLIYAARPGALHQALTSDTKDKGELEISIPLRASGVPDGYAAVPVALKARIDSSEGGHWESPWQAIYNERYLPQASDATMRFRIRRTVFEKFKPSPVTLRVEVAIDQAKAVSTTNIPLPPKEFTVPRFGICIPQISEQNPAVATGISCRSAMRNPQLTYVSTHLTDAMCFSEGAKANSIAGSAWEGSLNRAPAEFGISPVWEVPLYLSNRWADYYEGETPHLRHICPGASVTFTSYAPASHSTVEVTIQNFWLPEISNNGLGAQVWK